MLVRVLLGESPEGRFVDRVLCLVFGLVASGISAHMRLVPNANQVNNSLKIIMTTGITLLSFDL